MEDVEWKIKKYLNIYISSYKNYLQLKFIILSIITKLRIYRER